MDDDIGGAMPSGTCIATGVSVRIEENSTPLLLLAQGIEADKTYSLMMLWPISGVQFQDVMVVTYPPEHFLLNAELKVIDVSHDSLIDRNRGHIEVSLRRVRRSRKYAT
jgi:hypothetical protein